VGIAAAGHGLGDRDRLTPRTEGYAGVAEDDLIELTPDPSVPSFCLEKVLDVSRSKSPEISQVSIDNVDRV